jgi:hypothetical protein
MAGNKCVRSAIDNHSPTSPSVFIPSTGTDLTQPGSDLNFEKGMLAVFRKVFHGEIYLYFPPPSLLTHNPTLV